MSETHASDEIIQQYALHPTGCTNEQRHHIAHCSDCQATAAAYTTLHTQLASQPAPAFDFDLAGLVIRQIQAPKAPSPEPQPPKTRSLLPITLIAAFIGLSCWLFRKSAYFVFTDMSLVFYGIVGAAAAIVVTLSLLRIYKKYQELTHLINE